MDEETTPTGMIRIGSQPVIEPGKRRRRRLPRFVIPGLAALVVLAGGAVIAGAVAGQHANAVDRAASSPTVAETFDVYGSIQLEYTQFIWNDKPEPTCWGSSGLGDLRTGESVVITDDAGKTVGVGKIDKSVPQLDINNSPQGCLLMFSVKGVASGSRFYGVAVSGRPPVQYSRSDLASAIHMSI